MTETVKTTPSKFPHIEWIDLHQDGIMHECAILKKDVNGNIYFFEVGPLDNIDKQRLFNIITNRNADKYELWDMMSQVTLGNGMNALAYFHQLVKIITAGGKVTSPRSGEIGAPMGQVRVSDAVEK